MPAPTPFTKLPDTMAAVGARALSVGVADLGGRAFLICCTVAGNVVVEMADTTQLTLPIPGAGIYEFNWSVIEVISSGTTATATYYNLY